MKEYEKQRNIVAAHLKSDNVKEVIRDSTVKATTKIILKVGQPLIYYGEMATDIIRFIKKKRFSPEENPNHKFRRCPKCNKRDSIYENEKRVFCVNCDYETNIPTWNVENPHLRFNDNII